MTDGMLRDVPPARRVGGLDLDAPSGLPSNRRIALLIDADNVSHEKTAAILAELSKNGTANIRRAYGDWTSATLKGWRAKLHPFAIRPIQQFSYSVGKNATDIALVIDAMELLYTQKLDAFCIVSSDGDYTPLVMQLKANGHDVFGFGERKTPEPFAAACTAFLYVEGLGEPGAGEPPEQAPPAAKSPPANAASPQTAPARQGPLSLDETLVGALRGGVEAASADDGWALLSSAGNAVKRQAPIDPRNHGIRNFTALFEAPALFEILRAGNSQLYISDKRNKDRTELPTA